MSTNIPSAIGVPGISGPPDWLSAAASFRLDDVRWSGATQRTFGGGASQNAVLRATQAVVGGQQFIYLSFRAAFVPALNDQFDTVYLGLQKVGGTKAMVIRMQVHGSGFTPAGPPSANPPSNLQSVQISTRATLDTAWTTTGALPPSWINANARAWVQSDLDVPTDKNNRWAVQLRIPVTTAADITDGSGPNLGNNFEMWYVMNGAAPDGSPIVLGEYRLSGTTTEGDLITGNYPVPIDSMSVPQWDNFILSSGPGTSGGVALQWKDIGISDGTGVNPTSSTIKNGVSNKFVARPRNYTNTPINAGDINATFRIANWGSVADPNAPWDYIPGNSQLNPVISQTAIPTLAPPSDPPNTDPIELDAVMNLAAGKPLHQCMLVTLSGTKQNILNDSVSRNMDFDHASLLERDAEINLWGLPFSPIPRDVYLAVEKVNMLTNTPPGTNEGRFLESSTKRLIAQGGDLAEKLKVVQTQLSDGGDFGSRAKLEILLSRLREILAGLESAGPVLGLASSPLDRLISALSAWLLAAKENENAATLLAAAFDAFADWLLARGADSAAKLSTFIAQLNQWLRTLANDPTAARLAAAMTDALRVWLSTLVASRILGVLLERLEGWLTSGAPAALLPAILDALRQSLSQASVGDANLPAGIATLSGEIANWLRGHERLDTFTNVLAGAGLTTEDLDQLFPTFRIHVYHDTGENVTGSDGNLHPVLSAQSSFGVYAYHEGSLEGWQTSIQGAERIANNWYLLPVPNNGTAKITVRTQAVAPGDRRIPDDPFKGAVAGSERFFIGFFSHLGVASVANFPDRFVSPIDNYAYKQSEIRYEYYLHSTRAPDTRTVQGQRNPPDNAAQPERSKLLSMLWNVSDATGEVFLNTSYRGDDGLEVKTNDGCVKIYAVGQRATGPARASAYYIGSPNMDPNIIRGIQKALLAVGLDPGPADGDYGPKTAAAVRDFQMVHHLVADGEVGPRTAQALGVVL
jgi:Putative peptidoglycan binding domain